MQKGFTLAETLITMAVIGIIMALSIPAVIQNTNDTKPLFKKAYNSVESIVSDLLTNTAIYPSGDLSMPAGGSFCSNFLAEMNTIGTVSCGAAVATTFNATTGNPTGTSADATTTNAMVWYNLHPLAAASSTTPATATDYVFSGTNCDGINSASSNLTGINDYTATNTTGNTCVRINVDVNGIDKGANTNLAQDNRDIFTIYVTNTGQVAVQSSSAHDYNEAYLLQN